MFEPPISHIRKKSDSEMVKQTAKDKDVIPGSAPLDLEMASAPKSWESAPMLHLEIATFDCAPTLDLEMAAALGRGRRALDMPPLPP